ncbi:MAG: tryptophan--tRNA ligase [Candidatus Komeilibacteria bacterium]|nr:tryptophan--tRNA ligase [Candidatus Komeilibacteria bacterium]
MNKILLSGIKPTGEPHLGNYLGALKNWVALQTSYRTIYSIVDLHALTINITPEELEHGTFDLAVDLLALGIDPKRSILFKQSDVVGHTELAWIFSCLTPVSELERMTQYKDMAKEKRGTSNAGLFNYPILQAADILLYKAEYVPVGEDQLQHLELSRVIARKFNQRYKQFFTEIKPVLSETVRVMSLHDPNKKMSKSLGPKSYIALRDKPDIVRQKIAKAVTDSLEGDTTLGGGHNLLTLFKNFGPSQRYEEFERQHALKKLSYAELKRELAEALIAFLAPIQERQAYFEKHPAEVQGYLAQGAKRAQAIADKTLEEVRKIIGLS